MKTMQKYIDFILITTILTVICACHNKTRPTSTVKPTDTIYTVEHISRVYNNYPPQAFQLTDEAQRLGHLAAWQADSLRAKMCLDGFYNLDKANEYALRTLTYDEVNSNKQRKLNILVMVTQTEVSLGRYSECIRFCDEAMPLADELHDEDNRCRLMVNAGYSMYFMKNRAKGLDYLLRAKEQLSAIKTTQSARTLSYCYGQLMSCLWADNTDEAIGYGLLREALLDSLARESHRFPPYYIDTQRGLTFSKMADFYAIKNDIAKAHEYEQKFMKTDLSKTPRGNQLILDYYCSMGDFALAAQSYQRSLPYWAHKDTFCTRYASVLGMLAKVYAQEGRLKEALDYRTRQVRIKDSLLVRDNENEAQRLSTVFQMHDKELALQKKQAAAQRYGLLACAALLLSVFACAFAIYYYRQKTAMQRKDRLLLSQMEAISDYHNKEEKAEAVNTEDVTDEQKNMEEQRNTNPRHAQLTARFRQLMDEDKVYLQTDFSREKLQQMMGVSKNRLTPILHDVLGDVTNLSDYINTRRIAHACKLIREKPQMTVEALAAESGFSTTRNFRRCFKSQTGVTPAEYRDETIS